ERVRTIGVFPGDRSLIRKVKSTTRPHHRGVLYGGMGFAKQRRRAVAGHGPPRQRRSAGILLHPVSLPGPFGIGDLGPAAYDWVTALAQARVGLWQMLPLGPTGYADSPYQSFSSVAGNTNLLSPELLIPDGLLTAKELDEFRGHDGLINYDVVIRSKQEVVRRAWQRFSCDPNNALRSEFDQFLHREASWLDDFALFMSLKDAHEGRAWNEWAPEFALRKPAALIRATSQLGDALAIHRFGQFLFFRQWQDLRDHPRANPVPPMGALPIVVSHPSS